MSENVLPLFSNKSLMGSCLTFKSLSHFEFIFGYDVRVCSSFIDLHVARLYFSAPAEFGDDLLHSSGNEYTQHGASEVHLSCCMDWPSNPFYC